MAGQFNAIFGTLLIFGATTASRLPRQDQQLLAAHKNLLNGHSSSLDRYFPNRNSPSLLDTKRKRNFDVLAPTKVITECMTVSHSEEAQFTFISEGEGQVCGLYLVGRPDQIVEIEVENYQLSGDCENELFVVVDGWELNGNVVPSEDDHQLPLKQRFREICDSNGSQRLKLVSNQNAAMVQFKIPTPGHGFTVTVRYLDNPEPCNVLMSEITGVFKIANEGMERNCSVTTLLFPARISLLEVDVGAKINKRGELSRFRREYTGIIPQCGGSGERDFLELGGAEDLTSKDLETKSTICGYEPQPAEKGLTILCGSSTIRLVSSGAYSNSVTVMVRAATPEDLDMDSNIIMACPQYGL